MRDPARIERVLAELRAAWYTNSDLRLGQLVENVLAPRAELFYVEDDEALQRLHEFNKGNRLPNE